VVAVNAAVQGVRVAVGAVNWQLATRVLTGVMRVSIVVAESAGAERLETDRVGCHSVRNKHAVGVEHAQFGNLHTAVSAAQARLVVGIVDVELEASLHSRVSSTSR
jgi:hypothetical protein